MKRTIATVLSLTACAWASAQLSSTPPVTAAPVIGAPGAAASGINPFTGRARSLEDLQRQLETKKLETALLEEAVRNASLQADLENVGKRKQAEIAPALTQIAREGSQREKLERELRQERAQEQQEREAAAARQAEEARARKAASAKAKSTARGAATDDGSASVPQAPAAPRFEALSVSVSPSGASALVSMGGSVATIEDGQVTPYGRARITRDAVFLGSQKLVVHAATLGRVVLTEAAVSTPGATPPAGRITTVIGGQAQSTQTARQPNILPPPVPTNFKASTGAPSLQLPPGATLVNSD